MAVAEAGPARVVRSGQKDELYRSGLRSAAGSALHSLAGAKKWLEWRREIELLSDVAYFVLTTLSGYQTLGEEYVNIVQVDSTKKRVPSFLRRAAFISLHTVVPYYLEKGLLHLEHELQLEADGARTLQSNPALGFSSRTLIRNWIQRQVRELTEQQKKTALQIVYVLKQFIPLLHRLHLAVFYIHGTFYHLSKRIAGIRYCSDVQLQTKAESEAGMETTPQPGPSEKYDQGKSYWAPLPLHFVFGRTETHDSHTLRPPVLLGMHHRMV
ncbi:peroxisome biogenesis factor 10 isoform X2 [Anas platyrhynchos]|uniref:peroxisome biogenesis factor 10 isoform X2 n=1 Tax=Anas platyrhynchos TaxID=8839 RepID=UPI000F7CE035|nr:peroxisome biogenesis factor 10 isoform X2 [Anas platyrhynchos]|eukprot:XP_027298960.1 peroxisome biogenesis factor 10 isoform X2 [Anas platyrhynchos]